MQDIRSAGEVIVTDPITGGKKGSKLARFSLIPPEFLWALAEHYGRGALKYEDNNWLKGYKWSLSLDALERHLNLFRQGERYDQETGTHHLIAVAWHACALFIFDLRSLGTDDITSLASLGPKKALDQTSLELPEYTCEERESSVYRVRAPGDWEK